MKTVKAQNQKRSMVRGGQYPFKPLCSEMGSVCERSLRWGKLLIRVFELKVNLFVFLERKVMRRLEPWIG